MRFKWVCIFLIITISSVQALTPPQDLTGAEEDSAAIGEASMLVIRCEFQPDDEKETTGNGLFTVRTTGDSEVETTVYDYYTLLDINEKESPFIFEDGSIAFPYYDLKEYVAEISCGQFVIGDVILTEIFQLSQTMDYYGNDDISGVCRLIQEAAEAAGSSYDMSLYDIICIIHAGAGEEFDLKGDTPGDILSSAVNRDEYFNITGVEMHPDILSGAMVIPETENQDRETGEMPLGLLGPSAFTLCSLLGMPYTYDTSLNSSGTGMWDLMGYGFWNYLGFLPMHPSGYAKMAMGWVTPEIISGSGLYKLAPFAGDIKAGDMNGNHVYIMDGGGGEYFIIEARTSRGIEYYFQRYMFTGTRIEDGIMKYIMNPEDSRNTGMLIWHVDPDIIEVNAGAPNGSHGKGLDIEEADGLEDLSAPLGSSGSFGDINDTFSMNTWQRFNGDTVPSSRDNQGGRTGIAVSVNAVSPEEVTLFTENRRADGYPLENSGYTYVTDRYYVSEGIVYRSSDNIAVFNPGPILLMDDSVIISSGGIYDADDFTLIADAPGIAGEELISAEQCGDGYWLLSGSGSFLVDISGTVESSWGSDVRAAAVIRGSTITLDNSGNITADGITVAQDVTRMRVIGDEMYYAAGGVLYRYDGTDNDIIYSETLDMFEPCDIDSDGVTEVAGYDGEKIIIINRRGELEHYFPCLLPDHIEPVKYNGRGAYFITGEETFLLYPVSSENEAFTGENTQFHGVCGGRLIYSDSHRFYASGESVERIRGGMFILEEEVFAPEKKDISVYCYPNPCEGDIIKLRFYNEQAIGVKYNIYDGAGTKRSHGIRKGLPGENVFDIDISGLDKGVYILVVNAGGNRKRLKFVRL